MSELYHHGVKGQKWGVRRYQYADGSLTPAGKKQSYTETVGLIARYGHKTVSECHSYVNGKMDDYLSS